MEKEKWIPVDPPTLDYEVQFNLGPSGSVKSQALDWTLREDPSQLACQADDMASLLTSGEHSPSLELSEKMLKFAKDVRTLEEQASHYQAIIKKQQTHIQHLEKTGGQLISQLREENQSLRVNSHPKQDVESEVGQDWTMIHNPQDSQAASMMQYADNPLMKRIDSLQDTNAKLFKANHDWRSKWESLRQSKQEEQDQLAARLEGAETVTENLKSKLGSVAELLEKEKAARAKLEADLLQQREAVEALKSDMLHKDLEMTSLKAKRDSRGTKHEDHDVEVSILKQQMTVFMQDFENEKKEKNLFRVKLQKKDEDHEKMKMQYQQKIYSMQMEAKKKDDTLRAKTEEMDKLQRRVIQLMEDVDEARKKSKAGAGGLTHTHRAQSPTSATGAPSMVYPSSAGNQMSTLLSSSYAVGPRRAPEDVPGAWTCQDCTYINYPDRTVCDICGLTKTNDAESNNMPVFGELQSREYLPSAIKPVSIGRNVPDFGGEVEVDGC